MYVVYVFKFKLYTHSSSNRRRVHKTHTQNYTVSRRPETPTYTILLKAKNKHTKPKEIEDAKHKAATVSVLRAPSRDRKRGELYGAALADPYNIYTKSSGIAGDGS